MMSELTNHLWQTTFFAAAAGLLTPMFRSNRAHVRFWIWLCASFKFLIPFSLLMSLGTHLGQTPGAHTFAAQMTAPEVSFIMERITQPFPARAPSRIDWVPIAIFCVWLCGFTGIVLVRCRGWRRIRSAVRASSPLSFGVPQVVDMRLSPGLLEPGVVGLWRPVLLLPAGIVERLPTNQLESVLAHELCHVRRRDNLFAALHMVVEAMFWFHPLVWWIGARLVEERERACDEEVLSKGSEPRVYADAILSVCRLSVESPVVCVSGVTGSNIKGRIEAIMMNRKGRTLSVAKKLLLACAAAAVLASPVFIGAVIGAGSISRVLAQAPAIAPGGRLVAMLFDLGAMTPDEQSRARQGGLDFIHKNLKPADRMAVLAADGGRVAVAHDFTDDRAALESTILNLKGSPSAAASERNLAAIVAASQMLAAIPGKKSLLYFSSGNTQPAVVDRAALESAITAAQSANVALFPIDTRITAIQEKLKASARIIQKYGKPNQIEDRGAGTPNPSQIWRYSWLDNFHSSAEFELAGGDVRINWPPPLATYEGAVTNAMDALPGRHASFQIYPAGESSTLVLPLDSLSGAVVLEARVVTPQDKTVAALRDTVQSSSGAYRANFTFPSGSYVCTLQVTEQATGHTYRETITFEVK